MSNESDADLRVLVLAQGALLQFVLEIIHGEDPDRLPSRQRAVQALLDGARRTGDPTYGELGLLAMEAQIRMLRAAQAA